MAGPLTLTESGALRIAADSVAVVIDRLNRATRPCECCGLTVQQNRTHFGRAVELEAIERKLRRFAEDPVIGK